MTKVLLDQVVDTDYGQFDLTWSDDDLAGFDGEFERFFAGQVNGLVGAATGDGVYVNLARRSGGSAMRIVLEETEPPLDDSWEDVVEVSVSVPPDVPRFWSTWAGEDGGALDIPAGDYRVRVSATGRDAGHAGEFEEGILDRYLVQFWPAAPEGDAIVRTTSESARYWHEAVGSSRR